MNRTYVRNIIAVAFLLFLGAIVIFFAGRNAQEGQGTMSLQENIQTAIQENRAQASRTKREVYIIDREGYEKEIKRNLSHTRGAGNQNLSAKHIKFTYLTDSNASSLNSKITNGNGQPVSENLTDPKSDFVAVKGVRVLADLDGNGNYTDKADMVATLGIDSTYTKGEK